MSTSADQTDIGQADVYDLSEVTTQSGATYYARAQHTESVAPGRLIYATVPAEGTTANIFRGDGLELNFYLSTNQVHMIDQLGVQYDTTFDAPSTSNEAHMYNPLPTPYHFREYSLIFGGSNFSTHRREANVMDAYIALDWEEYQAMADCCLFEGRVSRQYGANLQGSLADVYSSQAQPRLSASVVSGGADAFVATNAVLDSGMTLQSGPFGQDGQQVRFPCRDTCGIPMASCFPFQSSGFSNNASTATSAPVIPIKALENSILVWNYDNGALTNGPYTHKMYFPMYSWLAKAPIFMPALTNRMQIRIIATNTIESLPVNSKPAVADRNVYVCEGMGSKQVPFLTVAYPYDASTGFQWATAEIDLGAAAGDMVPESVDTAGATTATSVINLKARRMDETSVSVNNINLRIKGWQFDGPLAKQIAQNHKANEVHNRCVVPVVTSREVSNWTKDSVATFTKNGFSGTFVMQYSWVAHTCQQEEQFKCPRRRFTTHTPMHTLSTVNLLDPGGNPYGVSQLDGTLMQDIYQPMTFQGSMLANCHRGTCFDFSSDIRGALLKGYRMGDMYLNGLWQIELTPAVSRPAYWPSQAFLGNTANAQDDNTTKGSGADTPVSALAIRTLLYEFGYQYAILTQTVKGGMILRTI